MGEGPSRLLQPLCATLPPCRAVSGEGLRPIVLWDASEIRAFLDHEDAETRAAAVYALGMLGPAAAEHAAAVATLLKKSDKTSDRAGIRSARALLKRVWCGPRASNTEPEANGQADGDVMPPSPAKICVICLWCLHRMGAAETHLETIAVLLHGENEWVQAVALHVMTCAGSSAVKYAGVVASLLDTEFPDSMILILALDFLTTMGQAGYAHLPSICTKPTLRNNKWEVLMALWKMGPAAAGCSEIIVTWLSDENANTRATVLRVLGRIGHSSTDHLPQMALLLDDTSTVSALLLSNDLLNDGSFEEDELDWVRFFGLLDMEPAPKTPAILPSSTKRADPLEEELRHFGKLVEVRLVAAYALAQMGPAASSYILPMAAEVAILTDPLRCCIVVTALGNIGPEAENYTRDIASLLSHSYIPLRRAALRALDGIGMYTEEIADAIVPLVGDIDAEIAEEALRVLIKMGSVTSTLLDIEVSNVKYQLKKAKVDQAKVPMEGRTATAGVDNKNGEVEQQIQVTLSGTQTNTRSWNIGSGVALTGNTRIRCGVPCLVGGEVQLTATANATASEGATSSNTYSDGLTVSVKAPAGSYTQAVLMVKRSRMFVPFEATARVCRRGSGEVLNSLQFQGVFEASSCFDVDVRYSHL